MPRSSSTARAVENARPTGEVTTTTTTRATGEKVRVGVSSDTRGARPGWGVERRRRRVSVVVRVLCALAFVAEALGAPTADVCYGARWEPTRSSAKAAHGLTTRPITRVPKGHPTYEDAFMKACLKLGDGTYNTTAAKNVTLPRTVDFNATSYATNSASGACADSSARALTAGQLFYNRADIGASAPAGFAASNTGFEKENTVRIMFVSDDSAGAHIVVLTGESSSSSSSMNSINRAIGLYMEGAPLTGAAIEEPRDLPLSASSCDPSVPSSSDCYELDTIYGRGKFLFGAGVQRGVVIGHIDDVNAEISMKFTLIDRSTPAKTVELATFDEMTNIVSWQTIPSSVALRGFSIRSLQCDDHCLSHDSCASCAADDVCGYCSASKSCAWIDSNASCSSGFDVLGECLDTCGSALTCGECSDVSGCGWCHTTGRCTASKIDGSGPQDGHCSTFSVGPNACKTCPGAIDSTLLPAYVDTDVITAFCNGRGTCDDATRSCTCKNGYGGEGCEKMCPGGLSNPCSRRGKCDGATGECFCYPGAAGSRCESTTAVAGTCECGSSFTYRNADGTYSTLCSGRLDANATCTCLAGWSGTNCDVACPGMISTAGQSVCGGHGTCNAATGVCDCEPCYSRNSLTGVCEQDTCATCNSETGVCSCVSGSMQCVCRGAFTGGSCDSGCNCVNGRCDSLTGLCKCDPGYGGELCDTVISPQPVCVNGAWNPALKKCVCTPGYTGELCDATCISCNGHGTCNDDGTTCSCYTGFDSSANCSSCLTGYGPYPECGRKLTDGACTDDSSIAYNGTTSLTISGYQCQAWSSQTPFEHPFRFLANESNACRNPSNDAHPWCYVDHTVLTGSYSRGEPRWEFCSVPQCKAAYKRPPQVCGVFGAEAVVPFAKNSSTGLLNAVDRKQGTESGGTVTPECGAINLTSYRDVKLHGDFVVRFNEGLSSTGYSRRVIEAVGLKSTSEHASVEVWNDGTVKINGADPSLPYSDGGNGILCVSNWMSVSSGLANTTLLQITLSETTVMNITRLTAGSIPQLVVVLSVPNNTTASGICATSGSATSVDFATNQVNDAPWESRSSATPLTCTNTMGNATAAPTAREKRWCDQCQYLGEMYDACERHMTEEGFAFARAAVIEACRMTFVAIYGFDRTIPAYLTQVPTSAATLSDTVDPYAQYEVPIDDFYDSFDDRLVFDVDDVEDELPEYIIGEKGTSSKRERVAGLPRQIDGDTDTVQAFPYPRLQDSCRSSANIGENSGYRTYTLNYNSQTDEMLEITMCGSATRNIVGVYEVDFRDVTSSIMAPRYPGNNDGKIEFSFTPWITGLAVYEVRFDYKLASNKDTVRFDVNRSSAPGGGDVIGTFDFPPPVTSTGAGQVGFEFSVPSSEFGATVKFTLTPTSGVSDATSAKNIELRIVRVHAKNYVQAASGYPPFGGFQQVACAIFQTTQCGSLKFVATKRVYAIVVSGDSGNRGPYSMQIKKVRAELTSVSTVSNNPALSLVRPMAGPPGELDGTLQPYKLAKYGDTVTVTVRASHAIDKPIITLGSYTVPNGLITGTPGGSVYTATVVVGTSMVTSGAITVSVSQANSLTLPSRGFKSVTHPVGSDVALVVLDNTPITIIRAWVVNPTYAMGLSKQAPSSCTSNNVNLTVAKYAKAGDFVAVIFEPDGENVATLGGTIGGQTALRWVRDTAPVRVTRAVDEFRRLTNPTYVDAAYARIDDLNVPNGVLDFSITFTDRIGNQGLPITSALGAPAGVTASSSLRDRLNAAQLLYDNTPPRAIVWSPSYGDIFSNAADLAQMRQNSRSETSAYNHFDVISPSARKYRLGDTVVINSEWSEHVTRPYGTYFRSSASSAISIRQSYITITGSGGSLTGKSACFRKEFRPRAVESVSVASGYIGQSYDVTLYQKNWQARAVMTDPCDLVGKGALAWSARADCQAESFGGGSLWIPMWSAWCRHGWGTLGYSFIGGLDPSANRATAMRQVSKSPDNGDVTAVIPTVASANDVIISAPIPLAFKGEPPAYLNPVSRVSWENAPKVIEVYIEPQTVRWNEYRRVVKRGDSLQIQLYTDQPVKGVRAWMGNDEALPAATHVEDLPSAMHVELPGQSGVSRGMSMKAWLAGRGLLALETELYNDGATFTDDNDWLDWLMRTSYNYRQPIPNVPNYPNAAVTCAGFWVQRGKTVNGRFTVRRLCPNRYYLRVSAYAAQSPTCTDTNDRVYIPEPGAYNVWYVNFRYLAKHQIGLSDGAFQIKWQLQDMTGAWLSKETSTSFFANADNSTDVNHLTSAQTYAVGPGFDPAVSCGRNTDTAYDQPGSAPWAVQDTTAPSCAGSTNCTSTTTLVSVVSSGGRAYPGVTNPTPSQVEFVALAGDIVTLAIEFTEYIASGLHIVLNDVLRVPATSVNGYTATFAFTVSQELANKNAYLNYAVYNLQDVQQENTATGTFNTDAFSNQKLQLQAASETDAFELSGGTCNVTSSNSVSLRHAKDDDIVTVNLTLPAPPSGDGAMDIVESKIAGADVVATTSCTAQTCSVEMTRRVSNVSPDFVDGNVVSWTLVAIAMHSCSTDRNKACMTRFKVTSCSSTVTVDFTPPYLVSVALSEPTTNKLAVLHGGDIAVDVRTSEKMDSLTYFLYTNGTECSHELTASPVSIVSWDFSTFVGNNTLSPARTNSTGAKALECLLEIICTTFAGTDMAGHALTNPTTCRNFSPTSAPSDPGWFMFNNVTDGPSFQTLEAPIGLNCMDSSVDVSACALSLASATLEYGNYMRAKITSSYPIAITDFELDGKKMSESASASSPYTSDNAWRMACRDQVRDDLCVKYATGDACRTYLCPTCVYAGMCDFSCGYCDSRTGFSKSHTITLKTTDLGLDADVASKPLIAHYIVNPAISPAGSIDTTNGLSKNLTYTAPVASDSCAGRCGGAANTCDCDPTCKLRGTCCADAGHCCAVGTPSSGAENVDGGCLRPNAVTLTTPTTESWGVNNAGVRKKYVNRFSTIYIKLTANKPIDVRSVLIGGVTVPQADIAIEYVAQANSRTFLNDALVAYSSTNDALFATKSADYFSVVNALPAAAYSWDESEFSRKFPEIHSTRVATIRISGASLVPQPDGDLSWEVTYHERSGAPFFTDNAQLKLTGTGPYWLNPPWITSVSYSLLTSSAECNLTTPSVGDVVPTVNGLTKVLSGHQLRTVVTFSNKVVVRKWTVEGAETNCYGTCANHGLCVLDPHILPPDEHDESEYITTWTSCRPFDEKEMDVLEPLGCGLREFIRAVDRVGNVVMREEWSNQHCFSLPTPVASKCLVKVRGISTCQAGYSATYKKFGPKCTASIIIESDGPIMEPTVQYYNVTAYANFPHADCMIRPTIAGSSSSSVWTLTCAGTVAASLPYGNLQLNVSSVRDMTGNPCGSGTDKDTDDGYKGPDVVPIFVDNKPPEPTPTVPANCLLTPSSASAVTITFNEPSMRPRFFGFGASLGAVVPQTAAAAAGFHTTWVVPVSIPITWSGGNILQFIVTDGEDDVGNVNRNLYGNLYDASRTKVTTNANWMNPVTGNVNCTVNANTTRVTSATCANAEPRVFNNNTAVTVNFTTSVAVNFTNMPADCVQIAGQSANVIDTGNGPTGTHWAATVANVGRACDGEVPLSICVLTSIDGVVGTTTVNKFFGAGSKACLIDNTAPVLQLIDFTSDNPYDSKLAIEGDVVTLYFEASEMITEPTVSVHGVDLSSSDVVPIDLIGPSKRRFPSSRLVVTAPSIQTYAIAWKATYTVNSSTPVGPIKWNATGFQDRAGNSGDLAKCADWNPTACSIVYNGTTAAQRIVEPNIDFTGSVLQSFSSFLSTSPSGNVKTLFSCDSNVSATSLSAASLASLQTDLVRHDVVAGSVFQHHLMSAQDFWWQRGGVCGAANGLMCRHTCSRCNVGDVIVYGGQTNLTVANRTETETAVPGDQCPSGVGVCMCNPTLGDQSQATYLLSTTSRDLVSKPTVKFTDSKNNSYIVPADYVTPVNPVLWPAVPTFPASCLQDSGFRDGVCDPTPNNRVGCWDGGDCCLDTCREVFSDPAYCQQQDCQDHALNPTTGRPGPGFWSTYNSKSLVARQLSVEWRVSFTVDNTVPLVDGPIQGTACCMEDKSGNDVLSATPGTFVLGSPCLNATMRRDTNCLKAATLTADNGMFVIKENEPVTLKLDFDGEPRGNPSCTIGGVPVTMIKSTPSTYDVTTWYSNTTDSVSATYAAIAQRINDAEEQKRRHSLLPNLFELNLFPNCSRGVTIPFECTITDCGGVQLTITDAADRTPDVCFDYVRPDATTISQRSNNTCSPFHAKDGDHITLDYFMDSNVTLPDLATLANENCTFVNAINGTNVFSCSVVVSPTTPEGEAQFRLEGIRSSDPAYLDAVNATYTELKSVSPTGNVVLGGQRVIVDRTPPLYQSLDMYSDDWNNQTCHVECTARVAISSDEDLRSCNVTIGGLAAIVTGTGSDRLAEVNITAASGISPGAINFTVTCDDLACNSKTNSSSGLIYSSSRKQPLNVTFWSDRPGHREVANEFDCFVLEMWFVDPVKLTSVTIGNITDRALSEWNLTTTNGVTVVQTQPYSYFRASHCINNETSVWGTEDWPVVPWNFTYNYNDIDYSWNTTQVIPLTVRLDLEPPKADYVYAFTSGNFDPSAGLGDALYLDIRASEPVVMPTVTFGDLALNATLVHQTGPSSEWRAGPYFVMNTTDDPNVINDVNGCFLFTVTLRDYVDHVSSLYSDQVNATGSADCPTKRVDITRSPPTIVWLQTEYVSSRNVNFTFAVNSLGNLSWVVLPRGSAEPTPLQVQAGSGSGNVAPAVSAPNGYGQQAYLGSSTPSPGYGAGGKGQDEVDISSLDPATYYDIWFVPFDKFGNHEPQAQSRWIRTIGLDMLLTSLEVQEGGYTDVIHVKLTQAPVADVSIYIFEVSGAGNVQLVDQQLSSSSYVSTLTITFTPLDWDIAQEVGVRAVDDIYVEGTHQETLRFDTTSLDARYASLPVVNRVVNIADNDDCGVVIYDPTNRPLERTLSCSANQIIALLNYSITEAGTAYADVYLQAAVRGDDVRVTFTSTDLTWLAAPLAATLTYNETNYDLAQRLAIVPVSSCKADLDRYVNISVTVSSASQCNGLVVPNIPVYIEDLQEVGLEFNKEQITGVPGVYDFTMSLTSQPDSDVQVDLSTILVASVPGSQFTGSAKFDCGGQGSTWTFLATDCRVPVTCSVELIGDNARCGDFTLSVVSTVTSSDSSYNGISSNKPLSLTVLMSPRTVGWYIRDLQGAFLRTPPNAPNGTLPLSPHKLQEEVGTLTYRITPIVPPCKDVKLRPFVPDTEYDRYAEITPREITFLAGSTSAQSVYVDFPRNYIVPANADVVEIWHDVIYSTGDPDYVALSPNGGGSSLPIEIVEYDVAGLLLGNGAMDTVLIDEPCSNAVTTQVSSLGFTLSSAPTADVVVSFSEMDYNATNNTLFTQYDPVNEHLVLGTTSLTFTPLNWNIPQPVMVSALSWPNILQSRTAYVCADTSSSDLVYQALNQTCYPVHICDCDGPCGTLQLGNHTCTFPTPTVVSPTNITFPQNYLQLSTCFNITADCNGTYVPTSSYPSLNSAGHGWLDLYFTTLPTSDIYNDVNKVQLLRYWPLTVGDGWSIPNNSSLREIAQGVQAQVNELGTYCLGTAGSAFVIDNIRNAGLYKEKDPPKNLFANSFEILPAGNNTIDTEMYYLDLTVLVGQSPETDYYGLNCTDGGNWTDPGRGCHNDTGTWQYDPPGCEVKPGIQGYFNNLTQIIRFTNIAFLDRDNNCDQLRRRRLLSTENGLAHMDLYPTRIPRRNLLAYPNVTNTTQDLMSAVNEITFTDTNLNPDGSPRKMTTRIVDQFGAIVEGPLLIIDTEGTNDPPIIDIDLPILYTEKEQLEIDAPLQAFDVDTVNWTECTIVIRALGPTDDPLVPTVPMPGDTLTYNATALINKYINYNTSMPPGLVDITAQSSDASSIKLSGIAQPAAYLRAMQSIVLSNMGPAMSDVDRYIRFCCNDGETQNNIGCGLNRVIMTPVNDPPTARDQTFQLRNPRIDTLTDAQLTGGDPENDAITYNISCEPSKGNLTLNAATGMFTYTPFPNMVGNDRFVYFTWDTYQPARVLPRPLQSPFRTVEILVGNGNNDPVAKDGCIEVWENSPKNFTFNATDLDSTNPPVNNSDIIRYHIVEEPELNPAGITLRNTGITGGKRFSEYATFEYAAYSGSAIVQRVREKMASSGSNSFGGVASTQYPGYNVTSWKFMVTDISGRVSNVASICVTLRLLSETNTAPTADPITLETDANVPVDATFVSDDAESRDALRHTLPIIGTLGTPSLVGLAANPYSKNFRYDPFPFYYGTDVFYYAVTDPHGATSGNTLVSVKINEINQPPQGACGPRSTLKYSMNPLFNLKQRAAESSMLQGYNLIKAATLQYKQNPERQLDLQFYQFDPFINDLAKFDAVIDDENVFLSCGSSKTSTPQSMYHDEIKAVALLAYDVDQDVNNTIRYVLSELPTIASSDPARGAAGYAGTLYKYVAPTGTFFNSTNQTVYQYTSASVAGLTPLAVGDVIGDAINGAVLVIFEPREYVHGPVTFKWRANDTSITPNAQGTDVSMTINTLCRGGERINGVHGETCELCPAGTFNSAGIPDQQTCVPCPAGSYIGLQGQTECRPCPSDTYSDVSGASKCTDCPINKRSTSGSDDNSDCLCDIGFVVLNKLNTTDCLRCALDRVKCTEFGQYLPLPYDGYWQDPNNGARNLTCIPGVACVEKFSKDAVRAALCAQPRFYSNETSDPAYQGEGCRECAPDHYRYAGFCEACDKVPAVRIFFILLGYCAALYVIFELATHRAIPALTILLTFTQITAQMQYFEIPWPKPLARWMQVASLACADLQLLGFDCIASSFDYIQRFTVTIFAPFYWFCIIVIAVIFRCWRDIVKQAYLGVRKRKLAERRRKLLEFDVDGKRWTKLAMERDGLPFDRPDLKGKGDDYTVLEKHLYGNAYDETLRKRAYHETVKDAVKLDLEDKKGALNDAEKDTTRKLLQTQREIKELQEQRRKSHAIIRANVNRAIPSVIICFWWGYMLLARTTIEFFECKTNTEQALLVADPRVLCNQGDHLVWKPFALFALIVYPFGLFFAALFWLWFHRSNSKVRARVHVIASKASGVDDDLEKKITRFSERYGMMYSSLRPSFYLWICFDLGKKLTVVAVKVLFPNRTLLQSFCTMVLFVMYGILSTRNPYVSTQLNIAEISATFMNCLTLIAGFFFQLGIMNDASEQIATYVLMIGLSVTTAILVFIVVIEFLPWMKRLMFLIKYNQQRDMATPDKVGTHESGPQGNSCYMFPSDSRLRYLCWRAYRHPLFERFVFLCVCMSLCSVLAEVILYEESFVSDAYTRIVWFDSFVNWTFVVEAATKIIAMGFILGDGAYLRDTYNCLDFFVIMLQMLLFIVNVTASVAGMRTFRFARYLRLARLRYIRLFKKFIAFKALRGERLQLLILEAKAKDPPEMVETIERARVIFEPRTAEIVEYHLRILEPEVLRLARGLIDEIYFEKFDSKLVALYESQTDPIEQTIQKKYRDIVYEWLAVVAEPGQKRTFLNTLRNIRDVALELGPQGIADEMLYQRYDLGEIMNIDPYEVPPGMKMDTREYKRNVAKDARSFTSTKAIIDRQFVAFQAQMQSDDKVEDALNALPVRSVDEDKVLSRVRDEAARVRRRNRKYDDDEALALITKNLAALSPAQNEPDEPEDASAGAV